MHTIAARHELVHTRFETAEAGAFVTESLVQQARSPLELRIESFEPDAALAVYLFRTFLDALRGEHLVEGPGVFVHAAVAPGQARRVLDHRSRELHARFRVSGVGAKRDEDPLQSVRRGRRLGVDFEAA